MTERIHGLCRMNPGLAAEFKRTFNRPLKDFWSVYLGFDLIAFDDWLGTPYGMSMREHLQTQYSGSAATLIERLIKEAS